MSRRTILILALVLGTACKRAIAAQPGWILEQKGSYGSRIRQVVGKSAYKMSWWSGDKPQGEIIADFAANLVIEVDYEKRTVTRTGLEEYLTKAASANRPLDYKYSGPGKHAGLACEHYSYSFSSGNAALGGWGGGRICFTKAIGMAPAFNSKFLRWLQVRENYRGDLGISIWAESQVDGPSFVSLQTVKVTHRVVPATEFRPPRRLPGGGG